MKDTPWRPWVFTIKTLPAPIYQVVTEMKDHHHLTSWQTVILALTGLKKLMETSEAAHAVEWVKTHYPDGKHTEPGPWT